MSFLDLNLDDVQEPVLPPSGKAAELVCEEVEEKVAQESQNKYFLARLRIMRVEGEPDSTEYEPIFHGIFPPNEDDEDQKKKNKARMLKAFVEAFQVPYTAQGVELADAKGNTAWGIVEVENDPQYGDRARVKRFLKKR